LDIFVALDFTGKLFKFLVPIIFSHRNSPIAQFFEKSLGFRQSVALRWTWISHRPLVSVRQNSMRQYLLVSYVKLMSLSSGLRS
jgi:hypothetical protein